MLRQKAGYPGCPGTKAVKRLLLLLFIFIMIADVEIQMQKPGATVFAAFDLSAENTDELSFTVGDELTVMQCKDDVELEWWWCRLGQFTGYVPQNLIAVSLHF